MIKILLFLNIALKTNAGLRFVSSFFHGITIEFPQQNDTLKVLVTDFFSCHYVGNVIFFFTFLHNFSQITPHRSKHIYPLLEMYLF